MVSVERVFVHRRLILRIQEDFDCVFVADLAVAFYLLSGCAESGATHQVRHQRNVFPIGHLVLLSFPICTEFVL